MAIYDPAKKACFTAKAKMLFTLRARGAWFAKRFAPCVLCDWMAALIRSRSTVHFQSPLLVKGQVRNQISPCGAKDEPYGSEQDVEIQPPRNVIDIPDIHLQSFFEPLIVPTVNLRPPSKARTY